MQQIPMLLLHTGLGGVRCAAASVWDPGSCFSRQASLNIDTPAEKDWMRLPSATCTDMRDHIAASSSIRVRVLLVGQDYVTQLREPHVTTKAPPELVLPFCVDEIKWCKDEDGRDSSVFFLKLILDPSEPIMASHINDPKLFCPVGRGIDVERVLLGCRQVEPTHEGMKPLIEIIHYSFSSTMSREFINSL